MLTAMTMFNQRTMTLVWTMLLVFDRVLLSNAHASPSMNGNIIYQTNEDLYRSKFNHLSKPRKRQVVLSMNGIQHIYESPRKDSGYEGLDSSLEQAKFGNLVEAETASSNSMTRQLSDSSFAGNAGENLSPTPRSDSPLPDSLERGAPYRLNSQIDGTRFKMNSQGDLRSVPRYSSQSNIYSRVANAIQASQEQQANVQNTFQGIAEHSQSDSLVSDRPDYQKSLVPPFQAGENISPENILRARFNNDLFSLKPRIENDERPSETQYSDGINPLSNGMVHNFINPQGDAPVSPSTRNIEPELHPALGPQVINALGPDNVHIIKKFYPLPFVQKVPRPIPVTVTKPVPYPVHQKSFQFVPRPYPQPFSKPDIHLSYVHVVNRGKLSSLKV